MPPAEPKHNWKFSYGFVSHIARESCFQRMKAHERKCVWLCVRPGPRRFSLCRSEKKSLREELSEVLSRKAFPCWSKAIKVNFHSCRMGSWSFPREEKPLLSRTQMILPTHLKASFSVGKIIFRIIENKGNWMINTNDDTKAIIILIFCCWLPASSTIEEDFSLCWFYASERLPREWNELLPMLWYLAIIIVLKAFIFCLQRMRRKVQAAAVVVNRWPMHNLKSRNVWLERRKKFLRTHINDEIYLSNYRPEHMNESSFTLSQLCCELSVSSLLIKSLSWKVFVRAMRFIVYIVICEGQNECSHLLSYRHTNSTLLIVWFHYSPSFEASPTNAVWLIIICAFLLNVTSASLFSVKLKIEWIWMFSRN